MSLHSVCKCKSCLKHVNIPRRSLRQFFMFFRVFFSIFSKPKSIYCRYLKTFSKTLIMFLSSLGAKTFLGISRNVWKHLQYFEHKKRNYVFCEINKCGNPNLTQFLFCPNPTYIYIVNFSLSTFQITKRFPHIRSKSPGIARRSSGRFQLRRELRHDTSGGARGAGRRWEGASGWWRRGRRAHWSCWRGQRCRAHPSRRGLWRRSRRRQGAQERGRQCWAKGPP
jgi:hypothetical protein